MSLKRGYGKPSGEFEDDWDRGHLSEFAFGDFAMSALPYSRHISKSEQVQSGMSAVPV